MSQIFYIFCHACYIPFNTSSFKSPNINLYFDAPINETSCNYDLQLDFDTSNYKYKESYMNPKYDYILSFKDDKYSSSSTSLKMCGLFDKNNQRIEIKNVTNGSYNDILISDLIQFLVNKNQPASIYCSFCRNYCSEEQDMPNKINLEFGSYEEDHALEEMDLSEIDLGNMDMDMDIDYNMFAGKKVRKYTKRTKKTKKRKSNTKKRKYVKRRKTFRRNVKNNI